MHITTAMTLPCFVLNDLDKPYPYIGVDTVADGTTMDAVARAAQELASAYYGKKWNVKIELYRVSPYLAGSESPLLFYSPSTRSLLPGRKSTGIS